MALAATSAARWDPPEGESLALARMGKPTDAAADDASDPASVLAGNAVEHLPKGALADKLSTALAEKRPLRVKLGIDPTAPDIHLGHAVVLRKLREFQDAGHRVVLIVGDYTARVGDPSGRSSLRPILSPEEIDANAATFQEQALRILDPGPERLEVRRNSEWLDMPLADLLALAATTTAAQLLERDDFAKRLSAKESISVLELLYPLLQAYDSVAVRSDVELGGTDQKFNLLLGRDVQRAYGQPPQAIMTMPLLVGTDGERKMSKSLGNQIGVADAPEQMYGKTMSIPDEAIAEYRRLLLEPAADGASSSRVAPGAGSGPPPESPSARDAKRTLARELVAWLHSPEAAIEAERQFDRVHVAREAPIEIPEASFDGDGGLLHLPGLIATEFGISRSEARRMIDQGGVTLGEAPLAAGEHDVPGERADGQVLKLGKRRFRRLRAR
jgi:tyrosyl-tRNA synthetase